MEIDGRTRSLLIKEPGAALSKMEVTSETLISLVPQDKEPTNLVISFKFHKVNHNDPKNVIQKRYKFDSVDEVERFIRVCTQVVKDHEHDSRHRAVISRSSSRASLPPVQSGEDIIYVPNPLDISRIFIPSILMDVVDPVASNLLRLWHADDTKDYYQVIDSNDEPNPKMLLRDQLRMYMGQKNKYKYPNFGFSVAENLIKVIIHSGYEVEKGRKKTALEEVCSAGPFCACLDLTLHSYDFSLVDVRYTGKRIETSGYQNIDSTSGC